MPMERDEVRSGRATLPTGEADDMNESRATADRPIDPMEQAGRGSSAFDPTPYLRQLRGRGGAQDYLDVKWRLLWLRREHPDAEIVTEHIKIDDGSAIFRATVTLPAGGKATGYGSETAADFGDYIEKAETKAIGRALNALGYGAQFAEDAEDPAGRAGTASPAPSGRPATPTSRPGGSNDIPPRPGAPPSPTGTPPRAGAGQDLDSSAMHRPAGSPRAGTEPDTSSPPPPIDLRPGRDRAPEPSAPIAPSPPTRRPAPRAARSTPPARDEPDLADFTHTAFWSWARQQGLNREGVERLIGRSISGLPPAELRRAVLAARGETE
jgi:hypothetical protein